MSGILTKRELASLLLRRVAQEPSRALPRQFYFNPAASVQFESERLAKQEAKRKRNQ